MTNHQTPNHRVDHFLGLPADVSITAYYILIVLYLFYLVFTSLIMVKYRKEYLIVKRGVGLCMIGVGFNALLALMFVTRQILRPYYPCFVLLWGNNLCLPMFIICSFLARGVKLLSEYHWARIKLYHINKGKKTLLNFGPSQTTVTSGPLGKSLALNAPSILQKSASKLSDAGNPFIAQPVPKPSPSPSPSPLASPIPLTSSNDKKDTSTAPNFGTLFIGSTEAANSSSTFSTSRPTTSQENVALLIDESLPSSLTNLDGDLSIPLSAKRRSNSRLVSAVSYLAFAKPWTLSHIERWTYWYMHSRHSTTILISVLGLTHFLIAVTLQIVTQRYAVLPAIQYDDCKGGFEMYPLYVSVAVYGFIFCPFIVYKLSDVEDAYGIKSDVLKSMLVGIPCYGLFLLWKHADFMEKARIYFPATYVIFLGLFLYHTCSIAAPVFRTFRQKRAAAANIRPSHQRISFKQILNDPALLIEFRNFTVSEFSVENLLFYETVRDFKAFHRKNPSQAQSLLKDNISRIYNEFIRPGGQCEVNLSDGSRRTIEAEVSGESPSMSVFDKAMDEIYYLMESWSYPRFLKTLEKADEYGNGASAAVAASRGAKSSISEVNRDSITGKKGSIQEHQMKIFGP